MEAGGFEAVRGPIPLRSKVILKAQDPCVLTQHQEFFYLVRMPRSRSFFLKLSKPNSLVW